MNNQAERYLSRRNPYRTWSEVRANEAFDGAKTVVIPLVKLSTKLPPSRLLEVHSDHVLMRVTAGWKVIRRGVPL